MEIASPIIPCPFFLLKLLITPKRLGSASINIGGDCTMARVIIDSYQSNFYKFDLKPCLAQFRQLDEWFEAVLCQTGLLQTTSHVKAFENMLSYKIDG